MATVVYQGFHSCLESQLNEPMALRLRPSPHFFHPLDLELALKSFSLDSTPEDTSKRCHDNSVSPRPDHSSSLSFLQALSFGSPLSSPRFDQKEETTYVHCSPSKILSAKSLALCTENLGNESGSDDVVDNGVFSFTSSGVEETKTSSRKGRKGKVNREFPPPLKSMRGFECIHLRPHREDGRLVLEATKKPLLHKTCFHVERSNGRLRFCILRDYDHHMVSEDDEEEEEEEEMIVEPESETPSAAEYDEEEQEQEQEQESGGGRKQVKRMAAVNRIQSPGRCVHGDQDYVGLLNWEHFCVATS